MTAALRGWCNRQHNWFWSSHWGFESSPPSSTHSTAPSSSGLGRRPLKAVTAVRICSGLHPEPGPQGPGSSRFERSERRANGPVPRDASAGAPIASSQVAHGFLASCPRICRTHSCVRAVHARTRVHRSFVLRARPRESRARAISTTSRLRCRTLVASCAPCARTRVLSTIEYTIEKRVRQNATTNRT